MKMIEEMTQSMVRHKAMPEHRARRKAKATALGVMLLFMGALSFFGGMGLMVLPFFIMQEHPGVWLLAFGALIVTFGFVIVMLGARAISDDAIETDAAPSLIVAIGKSIGMARGKTLDG